MRLFIAVEFYEDGKREIQKLIEELRNVSVKGTVTRKENLHLTLAFLSETEEDRVPVIQKILRETKVPAFTLKGERIGTFLRNGDAIYWVGIAPCPQLLEIYKQIQKGLKKAGFSLDQRPFTPHITLARRVVLRSGSKKESLGKEVETLSLPVKAVTLMRSDWIEGRLVYTPIFQKKAGEEQ